jgi:hypothetical protein
MGAFTDNISFYPRAINQSKLFMKGENGMKKILYFLLVVILLVCATPVAAKGGGGRTVTRLSGEITEINTDALTITVAVTSPSHYAGDSIIVQITNATTLKECDDGESYRISFGDLEEGYNVQATGALDGGILLATKIIQYVP